MRAGATARNLEADQCSAARSAAGPYDKRYHDFLVTRGVADPIERVPGPFPPGPSLSPSGLYSLTCCDLPDSRKVRTLVGICRLLGGTKATSCNVCCKSRRACQADACCVHSPDTFSFVPLNDCEAEDVASVGSCTCCAFEDPSCPEVLMPTATCVERGGGDCPVGPT